jgi:hypothetical protein
VVSGNRSKDIALQTNKGARARKLMAWLGKRGNESRALRKLWVSLLFQDDLCVWEVLVLPTSCTNTNALGFTCFSLGSSGSGSKARFSAGMH